MSRFDSDEELERRLRNIGADPQPPVARSLNHYLHQLPEAHPVSASRFAGLGRGAVKPTRPTSMAAMQPVLAPGRLHLKVMAGIVAALVVALAGCVLLAAQRYAEPVAASQAAARSVPANEQWTGIEWHDITATSGGLFSKDPWETSIGSGTVVAWPGGLAASTGSGVWTSIDGRSWSRVSGPEYVPYLGALGGQLLAFSQPVASCDETAAGPCLTSSRIWTSTNGVDWTSSLLPFSGSVMSLTTSSESAVICVPAPTSADVTDPKLLYVTTDGINWREASTPDDMSKSLDLQVVRIPSGYMALGEARLGDQSTLEYWASGDGFTWSRISPTLPNGQTLDMGIYLGLLGSDSLGLHSSDGVSWTLDEDQAPLWTSGSFPFQALADGRHILVADGWNTTFYVSVGDGHWRVLDQGGDIGSLPGGGQAWLLPDGVLYAGGGRLFFGQATSGRAVQGSLRPAATITPPPTPPAAASPSTTPSSVIPAPTSQPTSTPTG
jgi:hypothetical protein